MKKIKVGINGMGRIGKNLARVIVRDLQDHFDIVAGNDLLPVDQIAGSLRRDSVHGWFPATVEMVSENEIQIGDNRVKIFAERDAANIPWGELGVEIVFECSGFYLTTEKSNAHLAGGAKKVIMSAPPKDKTPIFVIGVNDQELTSEHAIISNASCTTNCLAPVAKAADDAFGLVSGLMSTTHAATSTQRLVDTIGGAKNRAALDNIIPTSTGAARAIGKVIPHLNGLLNGTSLRVPVTDGSVVEAVFVINGTWTAEQVIEKLQEQAEKQNQRSVLGKVLYVGEDYEVSADAIGSAWSSMVLASNTMVVPFADYTLVKLTSFYDNEMGYSYRMADLAIKFADA